jgi:hypothetical protein
MKKIVTLLLIILPIFAFSQGAFKNQISWVPLKEAKTLAKKTQSKNSNLFL